MLDSFMYETLEGNEEDMTNALIQLLENLVHNPQMPELIVIDDLDFIARTPIVDKLRQGVRVSIFLSLKFLQMKCSVLNRK